MQKVMLVGNNICNIIISVNILLILYIDFILFLYYLYCDFSFCLEKNRNCI